MQMMYSGDALEASTHLGNLLTARGDAVPNDAFFASPHDAVWAELERDGWLDISANAGSSWNSFADYLALAEVWGRHLFPLPFLETVLIRRWSRAAGPGEPGNAARYGAGLALGRPDAVLVPFADDRDPDRTDPWAPSLPLTMVTGAAPVSLACQQEVAALYSAAAVGCAASALERASVYAAQREAFGQPIVRFQAVRHRIANMMRDVELARTAALWSAVGDTPDWHVGALTSVDLSRAVVEGAGQVFGGISFTWEFGLHFYSRHVLSVRKAVAAIARAATTADR